MKVSELLEFLEAQDPNAEVRIAHQPNWPFEYSIGELADAEEDDDGNDTPVYIAEGRQLGYLPGAAAEALGWR